ncbi:MAG: ATP-binding cassette domain-containing protein [Pseudomonadota bacterium]|nr:ATP-binding cassette domain-containing protein [Pseudomonadota bacterium]
MAQLILRNITVAHSHIPLIEDGNLSIDRGDKVCLIGRNGAGKSTLLKIINGDLELEKGIIEKDGALKVAYLIQTIPNNITKKVFDVIAEKLGPHTEEWERQHKVDAILTRLGLDGEKTFDTLSGGLKRRVLLAQALVIEPDILLLDEPTNHLDIDSITWLEQFLSSMRQTLIFVTHDRMLMEKLGNVIVEIDNGRIISWKGHYEDYLRHKETLLQAEADEQKLFDKRLAQEEVWIRQGIKARRTRNEGRVRALKKMREQRRQRRERMGTVKISAHDIELSGKVVFAVDNVSYGYDDQPIIKNFSTVIQRGDKIGIIGPNGAGKSTLLNLLLGKLNPMSGTITTGTKLEIAYFDQQQSELDENKSVQDYVGGGSNFVQIGDERKHIISYLQDFLFSPDRARCSIKMLSGGERNRVMLAKLFLKPCNLLVLDEPTNDLDVETLELLEEQLLDYQGTLLLVSHDRAFLNDIVTSILALEGEGQVGDYVGGYDDWLRQRPLKTVDITSAPTETAPIIKTKTKMSYKDQRELANVTQKIEKLEAEQTALHAQLADPEFYKNHADQVPALQIKLQQIETELTTALARWEALELLNH